MPPSKGLLTPIQRAFMARFAALPDQEHCYLAGGTALAEYYLGHRLSFDLDFFTAEGPLILPQSYLIEALGRTGDLGVTVVRRFNTYVEFTVNDGIRVSSRPDLRVDKRLAYFGRAEPRDAVDLQFILREGARNPGRWNTVCPMQVPTPGARSIENGAESKEQSSWSTTVHRLDPGLGAESKQAEAASCSSCLHCRSSSRCVHTPAAGTTPSRCPHLPGRTSFPLMPLGPPSQPTSITLTCPCFPGNLCTAAQPVLRQSGMPFNRARAMSPAPPHLLT